MAAATLVLVIAYIVAVIGLFRKDRDGISVILAVLLTAGLVAGILKGRGMLGQFSTVHASTLNGKHSKKKSGRKASNERPSETLG